MSRTLTVWDTWNSFCAVPKQASIWWILQKPWQGPVAIFSSVNACFWQASQCFLFYKHVLKVYNATFDTNLVLKQYGAGTALNK